MQERYQTKARIGRPAGSTSTTQNKKPGIYPSPLRDSVPKRTPT